VKRTSAAVFQRLKRTTVRGFSSVEVIRYGKANKLRGQCFWIQKWSMERASIGIGRRILKTVLYVAVIGYVWIDTTTEVFKLHKCFLVQCGTLHTRVIYVTLFILRNL
jgi:hypothetical protein